MTFRAWARPASVTVLFAVLLSEAASAAGPFALVAGRRDPRVVVVDIEKAVQLGNTGGTGAVVSRVRTTRDVDTNGDGSADAPAAGLPSNVVVSENGKVAFVVNHGGNATPAAANTFQHGHIGTVAVLDVRKALDPANNNTTNAIDALISTGFWGPVGVAATNDGKHILVSNSEGNDKEDGAREISVINLKQKALVQTVLLGLGNGGNIPQDAGKSCAELLANPAARSKSIPEKNFGCFPATNAIGIARRHGGFAFMANGGTDDVSVVDVDRAVDIRTGAEVARIPVERGPWGLAVAPGGRLVAVTNRESAEGDLSTVGVGTVIGNNGEGNLISILDVDRAVRGAPNTEIARVQVGTGDATAASRPFALAFTPNAKQLIVTNFRTNNVSVVDVRKAIDGGLSGGTAAEIARIPLTKPDGAAARPRGVSVTPDGRYAVVAGGAQLTTLPFQGYGQFCDQLAAASTCGALWVIDLKTNTVVATVTGVANEPYMVDIVDGRDRGRRDDDDDDGSERR